MDLESVAAAFIAPFEASGGPILKAYQDIAGVWTIGYGTTIYDGVPVAEGLVLTAFECMNALEADVSSALTFVVSTNAFHPWTDNQIVALTSLAYNIGQTAYRSSTVLKEHNQGNKEAAAAAFLLWDKAHVDGQLVAVEGLLNRRKTEAAKYLS